MEQKLRDMSTTFNLWKTRNLTLEGRILLAKSLGISTLSQHPLVNAIHGTISTKVVRWSVCKHGHLLQTDTPTSRSKY
jgi:hypothetical protein